MTKSEGFRPQAPKDPRNRGKVYLLLDSLVEGKTEERADGSKRYAEPYYLGGRVQAKLTSVLPGLDRELAAKLQSCAGFAENVEEVGVSLLGTEEDWRKQEASFTLEGGNGSLKLQAHIPCDGREVLIPVEAASLQAEGDLSAAVFAFPLYMMARATLTLYLKPGIKVPELEEESEPDFSAPAYRDMLDASLVSEGDLTRLKEAAKKAMRGEDVTVAFIGGSITQGAAAKPISTECYAYLACEAFEKRFSPEKGGHGKLPHNIHFVKAGVGGTSSEFGACRYERDVLRNGSVSPDVVVIEFAVNDMGDETEGESFESLVAKAMEGPGHPAVVIMFAVFMDDWNLEERLVPIGEAYHLPMVSVKRAVVNQFYQEKPVITKRQYFYDLYHPTNEGHRIMADCIDRLFEAVSEELAGDGKEARPVPPEKADSDLQKRPGRWLKDVKTFSRNQRAQAASLKAFDEGGFTGTDTVLHMVQKDDLEGAFPEFADNWKFAGGAPMRFTIAAKDILLIFKDDASERFGKASVYVDGKLSRVIDPREVGWVHCNAAIVHRGEKKALHEVEIRVEEGKTFTVLGISYIE